MLLVPLVLLVIGAIGYHEIEAPAWSWLDSAYMAVITLTTVGFGEVHPFSSAGRLFTIAYCLGGIFTLYYVALDFIRSVVNGEIGGFMEKRRMKQVLRRFTTISSSAATEEWDATFAENSKPMNFPMS